jgi:hypothetical protein
MQENAAKNGGPRKREAEHYAMPRLEQNDKGRTHRPAEERSTETMAVVQKQEPGSGFTQLLQVCCRASMPAHSKDEAKQACMGRSNAEPRRNSIPKRE